MPRSLRRVESQVSSQAVNAIARYSASTSGRTGYDLLFPR